MKKLLTPTTALVVLLVACSLGRAGDRKKTASTESKALQGNWNVRYPEIPRGYVKITGKKFVVIDGPDGPEEVEFKLDPSTRPPQITLESGRSKDRVRRGIYSLTGNKLQIYCANPMPTRIPSRATIVKNESDATTLYLELERRSSPPKSASRATPPPTPSHDPSTVSWTIPSMESPKSASRHTSDEEYVHELLEILKETRSIDTFIVTLTLLKEAKANPHQTIPVVIRQAERLGIFANHAMKPEGLAGELATSVMEMIDEILTKTSKTKSSTPKATCPCSSSLRGKVTPPNVPACSVGAALGALIGSSTNTPPKVCPATTEYTAPSDLPEHTTPIYPPCSEDGKQPECEAPSDSQVLRALRPLTPAIPGVYEEYRDEVQIVKEPITNQVDPPRFFPLVGPAQLHHVHWKCTVSYALKIKAPSFPFPLTARSRCVDVVYLDTDHLHQCAPGAKLSGSRNEPSKVAQSSWIQAH